MARKIRKKTASNRMFQTGSSFSGDTILTSSFNEMSKSFANNNYLMPDGTNSSPVAGALIYMINEMQGDIEDLHSEISQSVYVSQVSEFSSIATGSFGNISSSFIPDKEDKYNLGSSSREWHTSYMLTASIGGGIFTSASLAGGGGGTADFSSVGESIIPDGDNTRDLGSSTKEFRNLYIDGTANIDKANISSGDITATSLNSTLFGVTGIFHINKSPTTVTQNGVLDARSQNHFILNNKVEITGIRGGGISGQIVTIVSAGSNNFHHAEKGVATALQFQFPLNRDVTVRGPQASQFIWNNFWFKIDR